ncbi:MAG: hypothetical protein V3V99_02410 [candidate division Zixibacteria bacterium]
MIGILRFIAFGSWPKLIVFCLFLIITLDNLAIAQENDGGGGGGIDLLTGFPDYEDFVFSRNNVRLSITNYGILGAANKLNNHRSCEYPANSYIEYMAFINLWVGGIIGEDTVVSTAGVFELPSTSHRATEFWPDGYMIKRSNIKSEPYYSKNAISDLDIICTYTDTLSNAMPFSSRPEDYYDDRSHIPLNVSITQSSYVWSYNYADDFIIFDYEMTNVGDEPIREVYIGFLVYPLVGDKGGMQKGVSIDDELVGFKEFSELWSEPCFPQDKLDLMWWADNDGDPLHRTRWTNQSPRAAASLHFLRKPEDDLPVSFNWFYNSSYWELNYGPRLKTYPKFFHRGLGTPTGDRNKYYLISHKEVDYDQLYAALDHQMEGFLPPPGSWWGWYLANGATTTPILSAGPINLEPNETTHFTTALVFGDEFHRYPHDFYTKFHGYRPDDFYNTLNFDNLIENAKWASFTFDNPGVDTDGNGYSGEYIWKCNCDRVDTCYEVGEHPPDTTRECCYKRYYTGDGVADFRTAAPPPPPVVKTIPEYGKVTVRWNGQDSEQYIDFMTQQKGFEGYKVYFGEFSREDDFVLVKTYDRDDFKMYEFDNYSGKWRGVYLGITRDSLESLYGNDFDPENYFDEYHAFYDGHTDKYLYFELQNWNRSDLTDPNGIVKVYPDASRNDANDTTEEGYLRYYEYEYTIENLQPSRAYYFNVTAFNKGNFNPRVGVMESSVTANAVRDYALPPSEAVQREGLNVMVFPNPYRIDGGYARAGYENRSRQKSSERSRAIHFANLPPICSIRIYTIDGDLVRYIKHYHPDGGPGSQEETWNVISRNTQAITTGIYIWHVRSETGEQTGKLVIMK